MNEVFADVPEALSNTLEILNKVEVYSIEHGPIMPNFPIPEEFGTEADIRKQYTEEDLLKEFPKLKQQANKRDFCRDIISVICEYQYEHPNEKGCLSPFEK